MNETTTTTFEEMLTPEEHAYRRNYNNIMYIIQLIQARISRDSIIIKSTKSDTEKKGK